MIVFLRKYEFQVGICVFYVKNLFQLILIVSLWVWLWVELITNICNSHIKELCWIFFKHREYSLCLNHVLKFSFTIELMMVWHIKLKIKILLFITNVIWLSFFPELKSLGKSAKVWNGFLKAVVQCIFKELPETFPRDFWSFFCEIEFYVWNRRR